MPCIRCHGTAIDPEHSDCEYYGDGIIRPVPEPCAACQFPPEPVHPYGCLICGVPQSAHGRRYDSEAGMHSWTRPTQLLIKARMRNRRAARLNAAPPKYHATTHYSGTPGDPDDEGYALCADCGTDDCAQYQRIQTRRAISITDPTAQSNTGRPWGSTAHHPF